MKKINVKPFHVRSYLKWAIVITNVLEDKLLQNPD